MTVSIKGIEDYVKTSMADAINNYFNTSDFIGVNDIHNVNDVIKHCEDANEGWLFMGVSADGKQAIMVDE